MVTKIRLQRSGCRGYAFYNIVIADSRAPRDGKFIEGIGTCNPNADPTAVDLNFDRALYWLEADAQPTDITCNILRREGVYLMRYLRGDVEKGVFNETAMQSRFDVWKQDKDRGLQTGVETEAQTKEDAAAKGLETEKRINAEMVKKVAEKKAAAQAEETKATTEGGVEVTAAGTKATTEEAPVAAE